MADAKKMAVNDIVTFINWGNMKIIEINWNEANEIDLIKAKLDLDNKASTFSFFKGLLTDTKFSLKNRKNFYD